MLDPVYLMIDPFAAFGWFCLAMAGLGLGMMFKAAWELRKIRRQRQARPPSPDYTATKNLKDAKDQIIMALLDDIATQTAAVEATEAAAAAKIDDLKTKLAASEADHAATQAALATAQADAAAAQALADRLKAANDALQAKVAA